MAKTRQPEEKCGGGAMWVGVVPERRMTWTQRVAEQLGKGFAAGETAVKRRSRRRSNVIDGEYRWSFARKQFIPDWSDPTLTYLKRWRFDSPLGSVFLHQICLPDGDPDPHSHPFSRSISLLLKGGYTEHRGIDGGEVRSLRAGQVNRISGTDVHRIVELNDGEPVWTLFWAGPVHGRGWGFYVDGVFVDHKEYLATRDR